MALIQAGVACDQDCSSARDAQETVHTRGLVDLASQLYSLPGTKIKCDRDVAVAAVLRSQHISNFLQFGQIPHSTI